MEHGQVNDDRGAWRDRAQADLFAVTYSRDGEPRQLSFLPDDDPDADFDVIEPF